jgi:hypothetical protein
MPRFVILEHDYPTRHWDFMLEAGHALRTWRLVETPDSDLVIAARHIGDHRLVYLDYEGPVSGGRGVVLRWDFGTFDWLVDDRDYTIVVLRGERLRAKVSLQRLEHVAWAFLVLERYQPED